MDEFDAFFKQSASPQSQPDDSQFDTFFGIKPEKPSGYGDTWDTFTQKAKKIAKERGYPVSVLLGQAALESAHGSSNFARERNNYFGYNAVDSDPNRATFYQTPEDSINAYINLIQDPSFVYSKAWQQYQIDHDPVKLIQGIKAAGYATSPNYAQNVINTDAFQQNQ